MLAYFIGLICFTVVIYIFLDIAQLFKKGGSEPYVVISDDADAASVYLYEYEGRTFIYGHFQEYSFVKKNGIWMWDISSSGFFTMFGCVFVGLLVASIKVALESDGFVESLKMLCYVVPFAVVIFSYFPVKAYRILRKELRKKKPQLPPKEVILSWKQLMELLVNAYNGEMEIVTNPFEPLSYGALKERIQYYARFNACDRMTMPPDCYWDTIHSEYSEKESMRLTELALWFDGKQSDLVLVVEMKEDNSYLVRACREIG